MAEKRTGSAVWTGTVAFGLATVPVKMYKATDNNSVPFNQLNSTTGARIRQKRVDESTGNEVPYEDIVSGFPSGDSYIVIAKEELQAIAPKQGKEVSLEGFVDESEINPVAYECHYYMTPNNGGAKAYQLLVQTLAETQKAGVGRIIIRTKEHLVVVRAQNGRLVASTLFWADEIRDAPRVDAVEMTERELNMAKMLVEALSNEWDHSAYEDEHRSRVLALIEAKAAGETVKPEDVAPVPDSVDLIQALEASLKAAATSKKATKAKGATAAKKPKAKTA